MLRRLSLLFAEAIAPGTERRIVGVRPGEKVHEEMITASDSYNTVDLGRYFAILSSSGQHGIDSYLRERRGSKVSPGFSYSSATNDRFLSVEELRDLISRELHYPLPLEATS